VLSLDDDPDTIEPFAFAVVDSSGYSIPMRISIAALTVHSSTSPHLRIYHTLDKSLDFKLEAACFPYQSSKSLRFTAHACLKLFGLFSSFTTLLSLDSIVGFSQLRMGVRQSIDAPDIRSPLAPRDIHVNHSLEAVADA
jgi:hypothetical protein